MTQPIDPAVLARIEKLERIVAMVVLFFKRHIEGHHGPDLDGVLAILREAGALQ